MLEEIKKERLKKLENFREKGIEPYPAGPFEKEDVLEVVKKDVGVEVKVAGRIILMREMGNISFFHLQDESGRVQLVLNKKEFGEDYKFWVKNLDVGDFVGAKGERYDTKKGEKSVLIKDLMNSITVREIKQFIQYGEKTSLKSSILILKSRGLCFYIFGLCTILDEF